MELLLDTHTFLWAIGEPQLLSPRVRELLLNPGTRRWVSAISLWEIAVKIQARKLVLPTEPRFYLEHARQLGASILSATAAHCLGVLELPLHHRDPFDRLLISQARLEGLTLATRDREFAAYEVARLW